MNLGTAIVLPSVILMLWTVGCDSTLGFEPVTQVDVQATVQVILREERAIEATVEAKAEVMAKAIVEATAQSLPTSTPVPPTSTPVPPTSTPVPPTSTPVRTTLSTTEIVEMTRESVVLIVTELPGGKFGSGTGIIYSEEGLALTNHHVVSGATRIWVLTEGEDGTDEEHIADVLGTNPDVDLAVIRFGGGPYVPAQFGSVADINLGDEVIALGYPLTDLTGASLVVTKGIVSSIRNDGSSDVIQHQAAVNPGNSGGPLISSDGSVVGINTYIVRTSEGINIEGFNVAVAIDEAASRLEYLETATFVAKPADAFFSSGLAYYYDSQYHLAIEDFDEVIRLDPQNTDAYNFRGLAYDSLGQYERAIQDYDESLRLQQDAITYYNRGFAYNSLGQYQRAIEDFNEAIRLDPQDAYAYNNRGNAYTWLNQYERAIQDHNEAIRLNPQYVHAYNARGAAYSWLDQHERAIQDYDEAIRLDPRYASAYNNRGNAYTWLRQYERAIGEFNEAIRLNPRYASAYNNRGNTYTWLDRYERAIQDYDVAIRLNPLYAAAYYSRGWANQILGNNIASDSDFKKAEELGYSQ